MIIHCVALLIPLYYIIDGIVHSIMWFFFYHLFFPNYALSSYISMILCVKNCFTLHALVYSNAFRKISVLD